MKPGVTCLYHGSQVPNENTLCQNHTRSPGLTGHLRHEITVLGHAVSKWFRDHHLLTIHSDHAKTHPQVLPEVAVASPKAPITPSVPAYDVDKAVAHLTSEAAGESKGGCAKAIRLALEAGGLNTQNRPNYAKDYGPFLTSLGFATVDNKTFTPHKGDVAVFQAHSGGNIAGHVEMYNGDAWISDFKQRDFWAGPGYRKNKPPYQIFRRP